MTGLIDTCVIIDVLQHREPFCDPAEKLLLANANKEFKGSVTVKSLLDIYYIMHRDTNSDEKTRKIITKLVSLLEVIETTRMDVVSALSSDMRDYEDAVMDETAKRAGLDCIITRNIKDYKKAGSRVVEPEDFLNFLDMNNHVENYADN